MVRRPKLNYDAKMPGIEVQESSPFHVQGLSDEEEPIIADRLDYIPAEGIEKVNRRTRVSGHAESPSHKPNPLPSEEYVPADVVKEREKARKKEIRKLAKKLYAEGETARKEYEDAKAIVASSTQAQREDPTEELVRAMNIVGQGKPMTKEKALEEAKRTYGKRHEAD